MRALTPVVRLLAHVACVRAMQVNFGLFYVKNIVEKKNEVARTVRVTDAEGKVETKTVLTYDVDAVNALFTQSILVRVHVPRRGGKTQP
jgi:DNA primase